VSEGAARTRCVTVRSADVGRHGAVRCECGCGSQWCAAERRGVSCCYAAPLLNSDDLKHISYFKHKPVDDTITDPLSTQCGSWTTASAGLTDRVLACTQFPRN
jgi:hypothetical protein